MQLNITKRSTDKKSEAKKIRRAGDIPAVLYSRGEKGEEITIDGRAFLKAKNKVTKGQLSTVVFDLTNEGKSRRAIVKDIQYHPTTYNILHLDFVELHEDLPVTVSVPIELAGEMDCVGAKLGGAIRQIVRFLKVRAKPKDIPQVFTLDVRELNIGQSKRLSAIDLPSNVTTKDRLEEVAVVVAKR